MPEQSQPRRLIRPPEKGFSVKTIVDHDKRVSNSPGIVFVDPSNIVKAILS